jgi:hypothetical protein
MLMKPDLESLGFQCDYDAAFLSGSEAPDDALLVGPTLRGSQHSGLLVKFDPGACGSWVGKFGESGRGEFLSGLYGTPDPHRACIVAKGDAYIVPVCRPEDFEVVPVDLVEHVVRVSGEECLLIYGDRDVALYDRSGLVWVITELSLSDLRIDRLGQKEISGTAWNPVDGTRIPFAVETETGEIRGGWSGASTARRADGGTWRYPRWSR